MTNWKNNDKKICHDPIWFSTSGFLMLSGESKESAGRRWVNPFHVTDLFWYPLKTLESLWFSDVFMGYQKRSVAWNGLKLVTGASEQCHL